MKNTDRAFTPWPCFKGEPPAIAKFREKALAMSRYLCYITSMARGESGRIVIEVEPEMKKRLYAALALSGSTLKDWFCKKAADYCHDSAQPSFFDKLEPVAQAKTTAHAEAATATIGTTKTSGV